jgi:glycosyltransferase involved in cell wall biosynthesis
MTTILRRPKHICHLTSAHPPFDIRIFQKECCSLAEAGHEVTLIASHTHDEELSNVRIVAVPKPRHRWERMFVAPWRIYQKARNIQADIFHFHDPELIPIGSLLQMQGRKVIYDIHEDAPRSLLSSGRDYLPPLSQPLISKLLEMLEIVAAKRFSALIAATPAIAKRFRAINPNTTTINNYPLTSEFAASPSARWQDRGASVAYVGGISVERGLFQMVDAMTHLPSSLGVRLQLAGRFSSENIRSQATRMAGWQRVDELGILERTQVAQLFSHIQAGLVLFDPSPNHLEARPNKLFEYMSAGIPVVASDFPDWRDIIDNEQCGVLVDPMGPAAIAHAIEYVITHPQEAEAMGRRGREAVEQKYNWGIEMPKLLALYDNL